MESLLPHRRRRSGPVSWAKVANISTRQTVCSQVLPAGDVAGPAHDERNPVSSLPDIGFGAPVLGAGIAALGLERGNVSDGGAAVVTW